ncbi:MAG: hypothetical protein FWD36_04920 [Treponema sp.]|nr:hypothetical protein [Treponema sp.]
MKRILLVLLGGLLCNTIAFAQLGDRSERGRATQEMTIEGFGAAHYSIPLDSMVRVLNTETQVEISVKVTGRIPASSNRIIDLSRDAWEALELTNATIVTITYSPPQALRTTANSAPASSLGMSEMPRLNTPHPVYHLLILDRRSCAPYADLEDTEHVSVLYNYKDKENGYLVAVYVSFKNGTVFPLMPDNARIIVNMTTVRRETIIEYIQSSAFKKFVVDNKVTADLLTTIRG